MKKCSSVVWRFFDRIENEHNRCYAVLCKLCDTQYKFFGNTTNLRSHLTNKHPLQWELSQSGNFEETSFRAEDEESNQSGAVTVSPKRRKYKTYKDKNVDILESNDTEAEPTEDNEATYNLVRQLHDTRNSDEEWLEEDHYAQDTYEPKRKRIIRKIKREVTTPPRRTSTYKPSIKYDKSPIIIDQSNIRDEYAVFGEYVGNKLRKFKAPRTRGNLQQLITTILWQAEYGTYDSADAVKRLLMYTVHEPEQPSEMDTTNMHVNEEVIEHREEEPNQSGEPESMMN